MRSGQAVDGPRLAEGICPSQIENAAVALQILISAAKYGQDR